MIALSFVLAAITAVTLLSILLLALALHRCGRGVPWTLGVGALSLLVLTGTYLAIGMQWLVKDSAAWFVVLGLEGILAVMLILVLKRHSPSR